MEYANKVIPEATPAVRESEIPREVRDLQHWATELNAALQGLSERLGPVVTEPLVAPQGYEKEQATNTPLGTQLREIRQQVQTVTHGLVALRERLEV